MGVDCLSFTIRYKNKIINLKILDTAGQGRFRSIPISFFRGSSLIIFVYEINERYSFGFVKDIIRDRQQYNFPYIKSFLVGNKICINEEE